MLLGTQGAIVIETKTVELDDKQLVELWEIFHSFDQNNGSSLTQLYLSSLFWSLGLNPSKK
uniref:EF-hand domain-containing protein n=1 Tax=Nymphaea colorata TaxID=210225 RepID=A0A5K0Z1I9_9MAGN